MAGRAQAKGLLNEFRLFIDRGNVMDMAVGVIVGGAFKAVADSLTADLIMPLIGIFVQSSSLSDLTLQIGTAVVPYGNFLQAVFNFLIMAFVVFCLVKGINAFHRKKAAPPPAAPEPTQEVLLLTEIRDLLKENTNVGT